MVLTENKEFYNRHGKFFWFPRGVFSLIRRLLGVFLRFDEQATQESPWDLTMGINLTGPLDIYILLNG